MRMTVLDDDPSGPSLYASNPGTDEWVHAPDTDPADSIPRRLGRAVRWVTRALLRRPEIGIGVTSGALVGLEIAAVI